MRKTLLFLTLLLLSAGVLTAQHTEQIAMKKNHSTPLQEGQVVSVQTKIDPQLLDAIKSERAAHKPDYMNALKTTAGQSTKAEQANNPAIKNNVATTEATVDISCEVSPELVQLITDAGGDVISRNVEKNLITANVPVASIRQIAALTAVKKISLSKVSTKKHL
jgi:hypothetical protein